MHSPPTGSSPPDRTGSPPKGGPSSPKRGGDRGKRGRGGRGRGHGEGGPSGRDYNNDTSLQRAASLFGCTKFNVSAFTDTDPFNLSNTLSGFICKDGAHEGSLLITAVNQQELASPSLIYGTPKIQLLTQASAKLPQATSYLLSTKWNGANVMFYSYQNAQGKRFVTAKSRMRALIDDTPFGNVRSKCKELLAPWLQTTSSGDEEHPKDKSKKRARLTLNFKCLPPQLQLLKDYENVQSICFELCGNEEPHLVKYDFPLALQPLFMTSPYGDITPFTAEASLHHKFYKEDQKAEENKEEELRVDPSDAELLSKTGKILPFTGEEEILALDNKLKRWALRKNKAHRAAHSLPEGYLYNNFVVEGWVLYLLDASGRAIGRDKLYKVKPNDIDGSHFELFDNSLQRLVIEALERIYQAGKPVNEETLRRELDLSPRGWTRFERDIVAFVEGRPNPYKPFPTEGQEGKPERMIIMMGVPGSGKSTIAKRLVEASKGEYVRVNQDEMGTRKKCEMVAKDALKKQKSVIVDRCNFDYQQRHVWIKMAVQFGIRNIDLVWLRIPFEVCKNRVFAREDHPTIPKGESGYNVIDNFARLLTEPMKAEGFTSIYIAESEKDANDVISLFVSDKSE